MSPVTAAFDENPVGRAVRLSGVRPALEKLSIPGYTNRAIPNLWDRPNPV